MNMTKAITCCKNELQNCNIMGSINNSTMIRVHISHYRCLWFIHSANDIVVVAVAVAIFIFAILFMFCCLISIRMETQSNPMYNSTQLFHFLMKAPQNLRHGNMHDL